MSHKKRARIRKQIVWLTIFIVIVIVALLAVWSIFSKKKTPSLTPEQKQQQQHATDLKNAQNLTINRKYGAAEQQLQNNLKNSTSTTSQRDLIVELAANAASSGDYKKAIDYYKQAAVLDKTPQLDVTLGFANMYMALGDKANSINYFKQAIAMAKTSNDPLAQGDIKSYEYQIRQQGGTP